MIHQQRKQKRRQNPDSRHPMGASDERLFFARIFRQGPVRAKQREDQEMEQEP